MRPFFKFYAERVSIDGQSIENQTAISQLAYPFIEVKFDDGITTIRGKDASMRAIVLFVTPPE